MNTEQTLHRLKRIRRLALDALAFALAGALAGAIAFALMDGWAR